MQHLIRSTKALLLSAALLAVSTQSYAQCSYKSKLSGVTITAPTGWDMSVNDIPRCKGTDTTTVKDDVTTKGFSLQEYVQCTNGEKALISLVFIRTTYLDESMEKDFHKMTRYRYKKLVFPLFKDMHLKPKNSKTVIENINGKDFKITKTVGMMGDEAFITAYLYTWTREKDYIAIILLPEDPIQEKKLMKILHDTLNSI